VAAEKKRRKPPRKGMAGEDSWLPIASLAIYLLAIVIKIDSL
jgi:hypothetical protein